MTTLRDVHDKLLAEKPDDASHVKSECPFCSPEQFLNPHGGEMGKTYSEEEFQALVTAAVAEATKELSAELDDLKATKTVSEWEAKIADLKAESDAAVAAVQTQLDAKVIEAEAAKTEHEELTTFLEAEKTRVELEAAVASRKDARVKAVSEAATFPEEYLAANTERWAAMDDETFESLLADYRSMAMKPAGDQIPTTTALVATRETTTTGHAPAAASIIRLRESGIDPRELIK